MRKSTSATLLKAAMPVGTSAGSIDSQAERERDGARTVRAERVARRRARASLVLLRRLTSRRSAKVRIFFKDGIITLLLPSWRSLPLVVVVVILVEHALQERVLVVLFLLRA